MATLKSKKIKSGAYGLIVTAIVIAVVVLVNIVVSSLPTTLTHINTDSVDIYEIGEESQKIIDSTDRDVTFYLIAEKGQENRVIKEMLSRYSSLSSHIKVKTIDPVTNPSFTAQYTSEELTNNSVIVVSELRDKVAKYEEIFTKELSSQEEYYYAAMGYDVGTTYFNGEQVFTSALDYVTREDMSKFYSLTGHNETELPAALLESIAYENIETGSVNLMSSEIPDDCAGIMIIYPETDISDGEFDKLSSYMEQGGNVILVTGFQEYDPSVMNNIEKLANSCGLSGGEGLVIDQDSNRYYQAPYQILPDIGASSDVASYMASTEVNILMRSCHPIVPIEADGWEVTPLLYTSEQGITKQVETTEDGSFLTDFEGQTEGQINVGAVSVKTAGESAETKSSFIWYSSPDIAFLGASNGVSNDSMFTSTLSSLSGSTASISVLGKSNQIEPLVVPEQQTVFWGVIMTIVIPVMLIILGLIIWIHRKRS